MPPVAARIALGLEYDGTQYAGWQTQRHSKNIQDELERALSKVADHPINVTTAGRTDAGVHAAQQVVHFDTVAERSTRAWVLGTNSELPRDISVLWAKVTAENFHARFSAIARSYRYVIINRSSRVALQRDRACWVREPLDAQCMHEAAQFLVGEHDFSSFRAAQCQAKSPIRRVESIAVKRSAEYLCIDITANAFLHHMVRNIAGALIAVGKGEQPVDWVKAALAARDRRQGGVTAVAQGLYLVGVRYSAEFQIPSERPEHWPPAGVAP